MAKIDHFECSECGERMDAATALQVCPKDGAVLEVQYDLAGMRGQRPSSDGLRRDVWRYSTILPDIKPVTLGEGGTPLLRSRKCANLFIKDEGLNPTGSLAARGASVVVSLVKQDGRQGILVRADENAALAAAAYAAAAGLKARVFLPPDSGSLLRAEIESYGAEVLSRDEAGESQVEDGWVDISPRKSPFHIEGLKTIGYEIAEDFNWRLPDAILYANSGSSLLPALTKGFAEIRALGWVSEPIPRLIAFEIINQWRLSKVLHEGGKSPIQIDLSDARAGVKELAARDGILVSIEGGAAFAAYKSLISNGKLRESDRVVLINPASGMRNLAECASGSAIKLPASRNIGGIIGPY